MIIINLTVWESVDALREYVYKGAYHAVRATGNADSRSLTVYLVHPRTGWVWLPSGWHRGSSQPGCPGRGAWVARQRFQRAGYAPQRPYLDWLLK